MCRIPTPYPRLHKKPRRLSGGIYSPSNVIVRNTDQSCIMNPNAAPSTIISAEQREQFIRDGYVCVSGLISPEVVRATHDGLLDRLGISPAAPDTWEGKNMSTDPGAVALTEACRTPGIEAAAAELVGPGFLPGVTYSPFLAARGISPSVLHGFIPVMSFPKPGPPVFEVPTTGYHIDGMHAVTLWPDKFFLVVFVYLSDTAVHGGATTVRPGSHRQVFEHWRATGEKGDTTPPTLAYADPLPLAGKAGDVIFMHYLLVHSGSANHASHIRVGLNTAVMPDPERPYQRKMGSPQPHWTPLDWTLRADNLVGGNSKG